MTTSTVPYALAVDDDPIILMDISGILEDAGFRTREADDGDAAIDVLPGNHAIGKLACQMETSDAARPFYRGSDHRRAA